MTDKKVNIVAETLSGFWCGESGNFLILSSWWRRCGSNGFEAEEIVMKLIVAVVVMIFISKTNAMPMQ